MTAFRSALGCWFLTVAIPEVKYVSLSDICSHRVAKKKTGRATNHRSQGLSIINEQRSPFPCLRNPDGDEKPWCYVMNGNKVSWEYCNITSCGKTSFHP